MEANEVRASLEPPPTVSHRGRTLSFADLPEPGRTDGNLGVPRGLSPDAPGPVAAGRPLTAPGAPVVPVRTRPSAPSTQQGALFAVLGEA